MSITAIFSQVKLSEKFIEKYIIDELWSSLSYNDNITLEYIEKNLDKPWKFKVLSSHPCVTMEFINRHLECWWDWDATRIG